MGLIKVRVIPNAKKNDVSEEAGRFKVRVTSPARDGKANRTAIAILAEYFGIKKGDVRIIRGERSREKVIEIRSR